MSIGFVSSDPLDNLTNVNQRPVFINANRSPTVNDIQPLGTVWYFYNAGSPELWDCTGSGIWSLSAASSSSLNTLSDGATTVNPTTNNIEILGTSDQITSTGTNGPGAITLSLPSAVVAPGSLEATGLLQGDAGATLNTGGTAINIATDSDTSAVNIATSSHSRAIAIGNATSTTGLTLRVGTGNFLLEGAATSTYTIGTSTTSGTITLGATGMTGTITLGNSTSGQHINIGTAAANTVTVGSTTTGATLLLQSGATSTGGVSYAGTLFNTAGAVATTATDGFIYVASCAGTPTGTPTARGAAGASIPLVFDTTDGKLWAYYSAGWHYAAFT